MKEKIQIDAENKVTEIEQDYICSFCGKSCFEIWKTSNSVIIKGDTGNICSKCIEVCQQMLLNDTALSLKRSTPKGIIVKNSDDVHCPHCGEYWVKVERVRCGECRKPFFLEH